MYADDMVLVASKEELKSTIGGLKKYLDKRKRPVNIELVSSKGGGGEGRKTE